ncbi:glutaredoxin 3 [Thiomicrorhabdus immobilis]|uniref:Glutaredoxin n=2 Tax=Thiomicrorhabdus immobilis TaxID=2791037 RepID=A0ABM7MFG6_9GAMM|nr:glutaredoxin 3 [Thiomicrorhabdus immobilis]
MPKEDKSMAEVVIYCTATCPYCLMAKRLLDSKGVEYQSIDIGNDAEKWAELEAKTGRNTVPQVFIGEHHIGGFDDLSAADKRGEIDPLLQA